MTNVELQKLEVEQLKSDLATISNEVAELKECLEAMFQRRDVDFAHAWRNTLQNAPARAAFKKQQREEYEAQQARSRQ